MKRAALHTSGEVMWEREHRNKEHESTTSLTPHLVEECFPASFMRAFAYQVQYIEQYFI